jgi:hypothetical protein
MRKECGIMLEADKKKNYGKKSSTEKGNENYIKKNRH